VGYRGRVPGNRVRRCRVLPAQRRTVHEELHAGHAHIVRGRGVDVDRPDTVAPFAGDVMLTVGGVVSGGGAFDTVTVTVAEVVRLPAASRALAVSWCEPLATAVVFQETEYGDVVSSPPSVAPSTKNCTPATPTLSEAVALTLIVPDTVAPFAGAVMLTVGGVVSAGGAFDTVTVTADEVVRLPA